MYRIAELVLFGLWMAALILAWAISFYHITLGRGSYWNGCAAGCAFMALGALGMLIAWATGFTGFAR